MRKGWVCSDWSDYLMISWILMRCVLIGQSLSMLCEKQCMIRCMIFFPLYISIIFHITHCIMHSSGNACCIYHNRQTLYHTVQKTPYQCKLYHKYMIISHTSNRYCHLSVQFQCPIWIHYFRSIKFIISGV